MTIAIHFTNTHPTKVVKYVTFTVELLNAVGDRVQDEVKKKDHYHLKFTGPLEPGENNFKKECEWGHFYNNTVRMCRLLSATIEYMDDPEIVVLDQDDIYRIMAGNFHPQAGVKVAGSFPFEISRKTPVPSKRYLVGEEFPPGVYRVEGYKDLIGGKKLPTSATVIEHETIDERGYMRTASTFSILDEPSLLFGDWAFTLYNTAVVSVNAGEWLSIGRGEENEDDHCFLTVLEAPTP